MGLLRVSSSSGFNILLEQLVALPFHYGAILLIYANDLDVVVTGRGNNRRRMQQALDFISRKCEDTSLVPLTNRVQLMMACLVSRVLHRDVGGVAQKRLRRALTQDLEGLRHNLWQLKTSRAT